MGYKRILVALDGSKLAESSIQHVVHIAQPGAHIRLLSVMSEGQVDEIAALAAASAMPPGGMHVNWPNVQSADPHADRAREEYLRSVREWLPDFDVTIDVRPGDIVDTIVSVAQGNYEVIVMATHARTGLSRIALGSIAEGVLHRAAVPVLIIPAKAVSA